MSTSDLCDFMPVCLPGRAARWEAIVLCFFHPSPTMEAKPVIQVGLAARSVKQDSGLDAALRDLRRTWSEGGVHRETGGWEAWA